MTIRQVQLVKTELNNKIKQLNKYTKEVGLPNSISININEAISYLTTAYYGLDGLIDELKEEQGLEDESIY